MSGNNNHQQQQPHNSSASAGDGEAWPSTIQLWGQRLQRLSEVHTPHYPQHAQMHQVTGRNRDLTREYGSNTSPPLDYPDSFARSTSSLLPPDTRRQMERLHPGLKEPAQLPPDSFEASPLPQPPPVVHQQVAADLGFRPPRPVSALARLESTHGGMQPQNLTTSVPQASTLPQGPPQAHLPAAAQPPPYVQAAPAPSRAQQAPAPTASTRGPLQAPALATAQPPLFAQATYPSTSSGSQRPPPLSSSGTQQAPLPATASSQIPRPGPINTAAAVPGETYPQQIQRMWGIDINDASVYVIGTIPIPVNIQNDITQIRGLKTNRQGFPIRNALKDIREHFLQQGGKLRSTSELWHWYGDARLLTRREWYYLATEGIGGQVPYAGDSVAGLG